MQNFESKRKNLFDLLDNEEKKLKGSILEQNPYTEEDERRRKLPRKYKNEKDGGSSVEKFIGKESIFKKPDLPIQKCLKPRVVPDYKINPHKWTKYSLEDADISDQVNTSAAFAFLKEMDRRKLEDEEEENKKNEEESNKIVFNKTAGLKRSIKKPEEELDDVEIQSPKFKSTTMVMPEYVVGQKPKKEKRTRVERKDEGEKKKSDKELKLSHLLEYDDDDDDEDDSGGE